jgi:hypothetical protein
MVVKRLFLNSIRFIDKVNLIILIRQELFENVLKYYNLTA